ncbi:KH domain-containing protein [Paenibacillus sp. N1-5-1-14]|uniref:KH domain-containing protein n=1 Tax=Paenibacillus TaxID=44249 RepID=UPI002158F48F|nr:KH domain-containing protein [Paenibacillus radicibacter]MCR8641775.1 KH domain-containing protein [Paenibacillus radicibacter]
MKDVIIVIAKALVDHPEDVSVGVEESASSIVYKLSVNAEDIGKVIGKGGRIAKSLRSIVTSAAVKQSKRVTVEIVS